jgi:hypothetical protein
MINDLKITNKFYNDPSIITDIITNLNYDVTGCGFGKRSPQLFELDEDLYFDVKDSLCYIHNVDPNKINLNTFFMQSNCMFDDDVLNTSSPHIDGKNQDTCRLYGKPEDYRFAFCGQIFMTPIPDPESSCFIYELKDPNVWDWEKLVKECIDEYSVPGEKYRAGEINLAEYKKQRVEYDSQFNVVCEIKNVYNKMVSWKAGTLHSQKVTKQTPSIVNQYFFAEWM